MTKILVGKSHLFLSNGQTIAAFNFKVKEDVVMLEIPWISQTVNQGNIHQSSIGGENYDDDDCGDLKHDSSSYILQMSLCQCGYHLAACNEQKQLVVWDVSNSFEVVCIRNVARKALCICFLPDCKQLMVADKTGDVYQFQIDTRNSFGSNVDVGHLLLGHLSMILDMVLTLDHKYLITCDRDEKIRVSCFPNCYNIYSFCVGHTEFVVKLGLVPNSSIIVSGSGDGTVRFWDYGNGKQLLQLDPTTTESGSECLPVKTCICSGNSQPYLAVLYCGGCNIYLYKIQVENFSCVLVQELIFESEPWDICWDLENSLWVFGSAQPEYINKYRVGSDDKFSICTDPVINAMNTHWKFFQAATTGNTLIPILFKRSMEHSNNNPLDDKRESVDSQSTSEVPAKRQKTS